MSELLQLVRGSHAARHRLKSRRVFEECHLYAAGGAVSLLGDNDLGNPFERGIVVVVNLFAEDEGDYVSILFDRPGFAKTSVPQR